MPKNTDKYNPAPINVETYDMGGAPPDVSEDEKILIEMLPGRAYDRDVDTEAAEVRDGRLDDKAAQTHDEEEVELLGMGSERWRGRVGLPRDRLEKGEWQKSYADYGPRMESHFPTEELTRLSREGVIDSNTMIGRGPLSKWEAKDAASIRNKYLDEQRKRVFIWTAKEERLRQRQERQEARIQALADMFLEDGLGVQMTFRSKGYRKYVSSILRTWGSPEAIKRNLKGLMLAYAMASKSHALNIIRTGQVMSGGSVPIHTIPVNQGKYDTLKQSGRLVLRGKRVRNVQTNAPLGQLSGRLYRGVQRTKIDKHHISWTGSDFVFTQLFNDPPYLAGVHDGKPVDIAGYSPPSLFQKGPGGERGEEIPHNFQAISNAGKVRKLQKQSPNDAVYVDGDSGTVFSPDEFNEVIDVAGGYSQWTDNQTGEQKDDVQQAYYSAFYQRVSSKNQSIHGMSFEDINSRLYGRAELGFVYAAPIGHIPPRPFMAVGMAQAVGDIEYAFRHQFNSTVSYLNGPTPLPADIHIEAELSSPGYWAGFFPMKTQTMMREHLEIDEIPSTNRPSSPPASVTKKQFFNDASMTQPI